MTRQRLFIGFVSLLVTAALVFAVKLFWPSNKPAPAFVTPPPAAGMPKAPDSDVQLTVPMKTYSKKTAAKKMKLPTEIIENPAKEITATADLEPSDGGYVMAAITDTSTGVTDIIAKEKPRPLFAFGGTSEIGLLGGVTNHGDSALVFARQDLLRVGNVHLFAAGGGGLMGGSFSAGAFAGASVRW